MDLRGDLHVTYDKGIADDDVKHNSTKFTPRTGHTLTHN